MPDEPCECDYTITDAGNRGWAVNEVGYKEVFYFDEYDDALDAIKKKMLNWSIFSDVWKISDHGNVELVMDMWT